MSFGSSFHSVGLAIPNALLRTTVDSVKGMLKLKFTQYPAIHNNYSLSNYTISNKKDFNRSSDILVIN